MRTVKQLTLWLFLITIYVPAHLVAYVIDAVNGHDAASKTFRRFVSRIVGKIV